jgi:hypothetical protein
MAQLVLARQSLRERHLPADQIEIDIKAGQFGRDLAAGNTLGRMAKIAGAYGATRNSQNPTAQSQETAKC